MMKHVALVLLVLIASVGTGYATDEVTFGGGTTTLTLPGVVVGPNQYYDVDLKLTNSAPIEFELVRAAPTGNPGAVSYDGNAAKLIIPSLRYTDGNTTTRYSVELSLIAPSPMRFRVTRATPSDSSYIDSADAARVAAWLRTTAVADNASSHFSVIGVQSFNSIGSRAETVLRTQGPVAMYQDSAAVADARSAISTKLASVGPMLQAGGLTAFRDVQNLPWGMIEPAQGTYNFTLMDQLVQSYQAYGVDYVGVAMPFASWDLATRPPAAATCNHFFNEDYLYLAAAGKMDRYVNVSAFATMLQSAVERYDGDGVSDMSGLLRPVKYWQIQNEPEGSACGQFRNDAASFVDLMRRSYTAVKAACPSCQVLNGGAGLVDRTKAGGSFWWDYAALGGRAYIDIIASHFNDGKDPGVTDVAVFETSLSNVKDALGSDKPIWITEFGVSVNAPGSAFVSLTESQAAAWYTRFYAAGLNGGVKRFFSDASSFFTSQGRAVTRLLPYYTNKLLEAKLGGFSASTKLAAGQYRFTVPGGSVYVLWTGVPAELSGAVTSYDIYGTETRGDAGSLRPSESLPLIVVK